ncbi:hypothetical protein GOBAR_DD15476 [Gossypium barbadense]|nr:hypothetical protein GOBAR_DD15476 [Gossypium barbadense]
MEGGVRWLVFSCFTLRSSTVKKTPAALNNCSKKQLVPAWLFVHVLLVITLGSPRNCLKELRREEVKKFGPFRYAQGIMLMQSDNTIGVPLLGHFLVVGGGAASRSHTVLMEPIENRN